MLGMPLAPWRRMAKPSLSVTLLVELLGIVGVGCSGRPISAPGAEATGGDGGGLTSGANDAGDGSEAAATCDSFSELDCDLAPHCQQLRAQPLIETPPCGQEWSTSRFAGCRSTARECRDLETEATDPNGHVWKFPSTCVPAGWTPPRPSPPPTCPAPGDPTMCAFLDINGCRTNNGCNWLIGQSVDEQRACVLAAQPVSCVRADLPCDDSLTLASGPDGSRWLFPTTCTPVGWTQVTSDNANRPACPADGGTDAQGN
jgi:hypothetical protein